MSRQQALFDLSPALPEGFRYQTEVVTPAQEQALLRDLRKLPFEAFRFHGFTGTRRIVSYGWRYDFEGQGLEPAAELPAFLHPLRAAAARFAGIPADALVHTLVTEYRPGAAIGWHRDKAIFGQVIGISLLSPCRFRFRRRDDRSWERATIDLAPRSAYLLGGPARSDWEHSIPAVPQLRYSVTFRTLRERGG